jgi:hypothetical protein
MWRSMLCRARQVKLSNLHGWHAIAVGGMHQPTPELVNSSPVRARNMAPRSAHLICITRCDAVQQLSLCGANGDALHHAVSMPEI